MPVIPDTTWYQQSTVDYADQNYMTSARPAVAPVLSLPTFASVAATSVLLGCTTDEAGGTLYFYASANASESAATIKASGSTHTSVTVGINTRSVTGLTASTAYYGHIIQVDSDTTDSNVVNTTQFTTTAAGTGTAAYAPFSVEIIQPVAGLTTTSRYYKQYTGLEYNVKPYVRGGDFSALVYSLTTSPSGMTINSTTGEISWPTPVESGSPHTVAISVTDGLTVDTVSWTVTVDTTNAIFVDSVSGTAGGTGAIGDPLSDITDWYKATKEDSTYVGYTAYYRTGTYNLDCIPKNSDGGVTLGRGGTTRKPLVHLAYPDESPIIDCTSGYWFGEGDVNDLIFDGFAIQNIGVDQIATTTGIWFSRLGGDRHTSRRNTFTGIVTAPSASNQSYIMTYNNSNRNDSHGYSENTFDVGGASARAILFYSTDKSVIESNRFINMVDGGFDYKSYNTTFSVRGNYFEGAGDLINSLSFAESPQGTSGNSEESWNYVNSSTGGTRHNFAGVNPILDPYYYIRNTLRQPIDIRWDCPNTQLNFTDNVIVAASGLYYESSGTGTGSLDTTNFVAAGNLVNTVETSFLNPTTGLLIDSFVGQNATKGQNGLGGLK